MMAPPRRALPMGGGRPMTPNPAAFNQVGRLQRHQIGAIAHQSSVNGLYTDLPPVGYHYRTFVTFDLDLGTTAAMGVTARFLSGHFGGNTNRFPCPTGLVKSVRYALNVSSPIYATDLLGNYYLQLINNRGIDPFAQVAIGQIGRNRKERAYFCIFNATTGGLVTPDTALAAATNYKVRGAAMLNLTLGELATAGLIPVQDIRIQPQLFLDLGSKTDVVSVGGDISEPTGNYNVFQDWFTTPTEAVRPDTQYVLQTRQDQISVAGTGEQVCRPQIGGIILRYLFSVWNGTKAVDVPTVEKLRLRVQQSITLESRTPQIFIGDERRWYSKYLPDELYVFDHITGFGDPTIPSLRDRIPTNQLTRLEYILDWASGTAVSATAELRNYWQQLVPLPRV
jgi:hypothetical protein